MAISQDAFDWFSNNFLDEIKAQTEGTPYTPRMILAVSMQETYYLWSGLYKDLPVERVLELCVGDTISSSRSAWPSSYFQIMLTAEGRKLYKVARSALKDIAKYDSGYAGVARKKTKFCHGFGIFQYDMQHFHRSKDFFLDRKWSDFSRCLKEFLRELDEAQQRAFGTVKPELTDADFVWTAIAYNAGSVNLSGGLQQGHRDGSGQYYGEKLAAYLVGLAEF